MPRSWLRASGLGLAVLFSGCSPTDQAAEKSITAESHFPPTFESTEAAASWARDWYTGGRVDEVPTGEQRHLVVFMHGSGRPVIRIGLYRWSQSRWTLVTVIPPPVGADEFLRATEAGGKIILTSERTGRTWPLQRPGSAKD
jgi:hypothetical protein